MAAIYGGNEVELYQLSDLINPDPSTKKSIDGITWLFGKPQFANQRPYIISPDGVYLISPNLARIINLKTGEFISLKYSPSDPNAKTTNNAEWSKLSPKFRLHRYRILDHLWHAKDNKLLFMFEKYGYRVLDLDSLSYTDFYAAPPSNWMEYTRPNSSNSWADEKGSLYIYSNDIQRISHIADRPSQTGKYRLKKLSFNPNRPEASILFEQAEIYHKAQRVDKALLFYRKAAELGHEKSQGIIERRNVNASMINTKATEYMGDIYQRSDIRTMKGKPHSPLVESNDYGLSKIYMQKRPLVALHHLQLAINKGSGSAMDEIGNIYNKGEFFPKDKKRAAMWWERAVTYGVTSHVEQLHWHYQDIGDHVKDAAWYLYHVEIQATIFDKHIADGEDRVFPPGVEEKGRKELKRIKAHQKSQNSKNPNFDIFRD